MACFDGQTNLILTNSKKQPMICQIEPVTFLLLSESLPVIDVRAPVEYCQGHIPGSFNIPLFDDKGRAAVGTLYKNAGHDAAVKLGYEIANPRKRYYIESIETHVKGNEILIHCWRGGLRSAEMAKFYSLSGYKVHLLTGGYKAYRHYIREALDIPARVVVLGGLTGTGKTDLLKAISNMGAQVVDLEHLACHKGSVFGALGQSPQPTNEQFENNLYKVWSQLDLTKPVWFEDESRMIGNVTLPDSIIRQMSRGLLVTVEMQMAKRIRRLVEEYALFEKSMLAAAINKIGERLGGARTQEALEALGSGNFEKVAEITLSYYDKAYQHALSRKKGGKIVSFGPLGENTEENAAKIIDFTTKHLNHESHLS